MASFMEHKGQIAHQWTNQAIRANATAEKWGEVGNRKAIRLGMMSGDGTKSIRNGWRSLRLVAGWVSAIEGRVIK